MIFSTHFRQILQSQYQQSPKETWDLISASPCLQAKGFLCTCTEDSDKSHFEPIQVPAPAGGCRVPPHPQQTGTYPVSWVLQLRSALYRSYLLYHFISFLPPVSFYIVSIYLLCHLHHFSLLQAVVHHFATTINTVSSPSVSLSVSGYLSPARADWETI